MSKELLELAAKAMHATQHQHFCNYTVFDDTTVCLELGSRRGAITSYWHPLSDDGTALRLAIHLGIDIIQHDKLSEGALECVAFGGDFCMIVPYGDDKYAATRLAIVKVAAALGGNLK
jgi:hypothetical protein